MLYDSFNSLNFCVARKTLYFIALAFVLEMLFDVLHKNALLDLIVEAAMLDFNLTDHVLQKFVLNFLEDGLGNQISRAFLRFSCTRLIVVFLIVELSILHLDSLAVRTCPLGNFETITISQLELTQEADKFITIVTFLWFQRDLFANHTR